MTRRKTTAFTFSVTLSRVMMSCGGTSNASCRSEMRTIRSIGANTRKMPGPLASLSRRPRRKMTPRSYSGRILIELSRYKPKITTAISANGMREILLLFLLRLSQRLGDRRRHVARQRVGGEQIDAAVELPRVLRPIHAGVVHTRADDESD